MCHLFWKTWSQISGHLHSYGASLSIASLGYFVLPFIRHFLNFFYTSEVTILHLLTFLIDPSWSAIQGQKCKFSGHLQSLGTRTLSSLETFTELKKDPQNKINHYGASWGRRDLEYRVCIGQEEKRVVLGRRFVIISTIPRPPLSIYKELKFCVIQLILAAGA